MHSAQKILIPMENDKMTLITHQQRTKKKLNKKKLPHPARWSPKCFTRTWKTFFKLTNERTTSTEITLTDGLLKMPVNAIIIFFKKSSLRDTGMGPVALAQTHTHSLTAAQSKTRAHTLRILLHRGRKKNLIWSNPNEYRKKQKTKISKLTSYFVSKKLSHKWRVPSNGRFLFVRFLTPVESLNLQQNV